MSTFEESNIFKVTESFYHFRIRNDPAFENTYFFPKIAVSSSNKNDMTIFIHIYEVVETSTPVFKSEIVINQTVPSIDDYIRLFQNNVFTSTFENPALALDLMVIEVQKIAYYASNGENTAPAISVENAKTKESYTISIQNFL